jgi:hypothetical protein
MLEIAMLLEPLDPKTWCEIDDLLVRQYSLGHGIAWDDRTFGRRGDRREHEEHEFHQSPPPIIFVPRER